MRNYDNEAYAINRVVGTFVRHKDGTAIEVLQIIDRQVVAKELISGKDRVFPYNELDINPVPLGYANLQGGVVTYLARSPMRNDWKQGARWKNLRWIDFGKEEAPFRDKIPNKILGATIHGIYPSFNDTVKALVGGKGKIFSKAWHRHFAMDVDWNIFHRGKYLIGKMVDPARREYKLDDDYWWTKEALEESL